MRLGSIYLIVNDFKKSIAFYEKLLKIPLSFENAGRFAGFKFDGQCISLLNAHFDAENPEKIVRKGEDAAEALLKTALAPNTNKFALNFWVEDLRAEYNRIKALNISDKLSRVKYICYVSPYYYFQMYDPDDNLIEISGKYTPEEGELGE